MRSTLKIGTAIRSPVEDQLFDADAGITRDALLHGSGQTNNDRPWWVSGRWIVERVNSAESVLSRIFEGSSGLPATFLESGVMMTLEELDTSVTGNLHCNGMADSVYRGAIFGVARERARKKTSRSRPPAEAYWRRACNILHFLRPGGWTRTLSRRSRQYATVVASRSSATVSAGCGEAFETTGSTGCFLTRLEIDCSKSILAGSLILRRRSRTKRERKKEAVRKVGMLMQMGPIPMSVPYD